ncbi:MAG: GTPase Era [Bdellovibrionales bacterium]|nr:GTPase Era [Bdellovibrionales bacterium]
MSPVAQKKKTVKKPEKKKPRVEARKQGEKRNTFKSATVAILGRPNAGKSTLLNALLETPLSATSDRPQTTRSNVKGIVQLHDDKGGWTGQLVLVDTPGVNFQKGLLERSMHMAVEGALEDVDVAIWVADARTFDRDLRDIEQKRRGEDKIAGWLRDMLQNSTHPGAKTKWILAISKCDMVDKPSLLPLMERAALTVPEFLHIVPVAAAKGLKSKDSNLQGLLKLVESIMPEGPELYDQDAWTDLNQKQLLQNLVREAVFRNSRKEVPYETDCSVERFIDAVEEDGKVKRRPEADAVIWVSRTSLKPIMVGKGGSRIRDIGIQVRERYKDVTGDDLILRMFVKVVEKWSTRPAALQELGYSLSE